MMKTMKMVAMAALAAGGLALGASVQAATHSGGHGSWSGGHGSSSGGHWNGGGWHGGGYWRGGYWHGYYPFHAVAVGFYFGAPWVLGPWYWWGYPYAYDYYGGYGYPAAPAEPAAAPYPDGAMMPPTTQADPSAPGAPTQAPAYMNYCVSAKAYFPKVTSCPEGWKFVPAR